MENRAWKYNNTLLKEANSYAGHADEWLEKNPYGWYNNEEDYGVDWDDPDQWYVGPGNPDWFDMREIFDYLKDIESMADSYEEKIESLKSDYNMSQAAAEYWLDKYNDYYSRDLQESTGRYLVHYYKAGGWDKYGGGIKSTSQGYLDRNWNKHTFRGTKPEAIVSSLNPEDFFTSYEEAESAINNYLHNARPHYRNGMPTYASLRVEEV